MRNRVFKIKYEFKGSGAQKKKSATLDIYAQSELEAIHSAELYGFLEFGSDFVENCKSWRLCR